MSRRVLITGSWVAPLALYAMTAVPMLFGAWAMSKPGRYLEDEGTTATPQS